jgi:NTP pyrophosphatase (non-canonical NTP hydrolase)
MSLQLTEQAQLKDFQDYVAKMIKERGFENDTPTKVFVLLTKEVGGLARAIRETWPTKGDNAEVVKSKIQEQLADIFIYLLEMSNMHGVSLDQAFREREAVNMKRQWSAVHRS